MYIYISIYITEQFAHRLTFLELRLDKKKNERHTEREIYINI